MGQAVWRKRNRFIAGSMVFMVLVAVLFSSLVPAAEAAHDCPGEDCPVCAFVRYCEELLRLAGSPGAEGAAGFFAVLLCCTLSVTVPLLITGTPVARKVRLND